MSAPAPLPMSPATSLHGGALRPGVLGLPRAPPLRDGLRFLLSQGPQTLPPPALHSLGQILGAKCCFRKPPLPTSPLAVLQAVGPCRGAGRNGSESHRGTRPLQGPALGVCTATRPPVLKPLVPGEPTPQFLFSSPQGTEGSQPRMDPGAHSSEAGVSWGDTGAGIRMGRDGAGPGVGLIAHPPRLGVEGGVRRQDQHPRPG